MGETRGAVLRWLCGASYALALACAVPASAQSNAKDLAAREYFEAGRAAFEQADYESALRYFQHAHRMSGRAALWYNIGVAADRLNREQDALEAFERYLKETERPTREAEVREHIEALRRSIAEKQAQQRALREAGIEDDSDLRLQTVADIDDAGAPREHGAVDQASGKKKWPWLVAAAASVAVAGVATGVLLSKRSNQGSASSGGLKVNW